MVIRHHGAEMAIAKVRATQIRHALLLGSPDSEEDTPPGVRSRRREGRHGLRPWRAVADADESASRARHLYPTRDADDRYDSPPTTARRVAWRDDGGAGWDARERSWREDAAAEEAASTRRPRRGADDPPEAASSSRRAGEPPRERDRTPRTPRDEGWGGKPWRAWGGHTPGRYSDRSSEWGTPGVRRFGGETSARGGSPLGDAATPPPPDFSVAASPTPRFPAHELEAEHARARLQVEAILDEHREEANRRGRELVEATAGAAREHAERGAEATRRARGEIVDFLEEAHARSASKIAELQEALETREWQLDASVEALREVQRRLEGALDATGGGQGRPTRSSRSPFKRPRRRNARRRNTSRPTRSTPNGRSSRRHRHPRSEEASPRPNARGRWWRGNARGRRASKRRRTIPRARPWRRRPRRPLPGTTPPARSSRLCEHL